MRQILGAVAAAACAALAALIMAEYEFTGITPWVAALAVGVLVGEVVGSVGRWRSAAATAFAAVTAAGGLLWGQWLESDSGVEPWAVVAWPAAALAAAVAAWSVRPRRSAGS